jgi:thiamine kinase-like enzyme
MRNACLQESAMPVNAEQLEEWLEQHAAVHLPELHIDPHRIKVLHVLNWGGFVNRSFTISDGSRQYHLKITNEQDHVTRLRRWLQMHDRLEQRYRAPRLIRWVDFPKIGFAGILFEHVDGWQADFCANPDLLKRLVEFAFRLHADEELSSDLARSGSAKTYRDYFVETYINRFTADLDVIKANRPAFITSGLLQWMHDETGRLRENVDSAKAFHGLAVEPVHGDLHEGNVIVTATDWFIVDWDDLALGDPALELAILVWPLVWKGQSWQGFVAGATDQRVAERMEVCFRAQLLDEVIDTVADYVEAETVPSRKTEVQLAKKLRHEEALHRYRQVQ